MKKLLSEGAEAKIYLETKRLEKKTKEKIIKNNKKIEEKNIVKERIKKNYRHKILDEKILYSRTKREYKILEKLEEYNEKNKIKTAPKPIFLDKNKNIIRIEYIEGKELNKKDYEKKIIINKIAKKIFIIHENKIIHGDLTPKNILKTKQKLKTEKKSKNKIKEDIIFIDFGLSFFSERIEDKIYDLYMTKETFSEKFYNLLLEEYKKLYSKKYGEKKTKILEERIKRIISRGKNKQKQKTQ